MSVRTPYRLTGLYEKDYSALQRMLDELFRQDSTFVSQGATNIADGSIYNRHIASDAAIAQSKIAGLVSDLASKVPNTRQINTDTPLLGGGDLSTNRTLSISVLFDANGDIISDNGDFVWS